MQSLSEFRSPLLSSLGDLKLSDEEALQQISFKINEALEIPNDTENKDFWIDLISKKKTFSASQAPTESIEDTLKQKVNLEISKLKKTASDIKNNKAIKGDVDAEVTKAVLDGFRSIATSIASQMTHLVLSDARRQFAALVDSTAIDKELKIKKGAATDLAELLVERMNDFIDEFDADIDEDFSNEIQNILYESIKLTNPVSHSLAQVLMLVTNGAYMLRLESRYMFAAIQHYTEVPAKDRLSRMLIISRLLVLFGHLNNKLDEINDLSNNIFSYRQAIVKGDAQEDSNFSALFHAFARDYLTIIGQQISTEASYVLGKRLLTISQELIQTHLTEYMKSRIARHSLPHLSLAELPQNSKNYLEVISAVTTLDFADVTASWWNEVLLGYDRLLSVDANVINTVGYATIMLTGSITPIEGHEEFLDTLYSLLLEFLENNGSQLSPENYGIYFDQFLNTMAKRDPLVQKYYLQLKIQNVYCISSKQPYDVVFNEFVANLDEAKTMGQSFESDKYEKILKLLFNAYAVHTGDNKASSKKTFKFIKEFSGATVPLEKFNHANFGFKVKEAAKQKRNADQYATVVIRFSDGKNDANLIKKEKTPNKIEIEDGLEAEIKSLKTPKLERTDGSDHQIKPSPIQEVESPQELPSLQKQPSIIPNKELETLVQEQIKEKEKEEKIEEQITKILEEPQAKEEEPQVKENQPQTKENQPEIKKDDSKVETPAEPEVDLNELKGDLTNTEKKILLQKNLKDVLDQIDEITDGDGNTTKFVYVKLIPKLSDCYKTLFG